MTRGLRRASRLACGAFLGAFPLWTGCGPGQQAAEHAALAQRADSFLSAARDSGFEGAVVLAVDGAIVLEKGYGWRDRERREPIEPETPFWIASITKQFTASAILKLVEEGKLALDDSIAKFFEAVPLPRQATTVHQLLTHTAGLGQNYVADGIADRDAAVAAVLAQPLEHRLGQDFTYSNDAYSVLAALVEVVSGETYEGYLRTRLLDPAGLRHTGFWGPAESPEVPPIEAARPDSVLRPNWGYRGGIGMCSSAADLYRWHFALEGGHVLSAASRAKLSTPFVPRESLGVGYGWFVSKTPQGTTSIWTRGYEDFGHGAVLALYPEDGVVIAVTSKSGERRGAPWSHQLVKDLEAIALSRETKPR